ncbi:MAG: acetylornithine deacetylase [Phycisphaerales bacterium]|nr:acetylornithine deacetylase [Phycisphaerales bacterium]
MTNSVRLTDMELLARLIAFDTTSARPNRPLADFICDYLSCGAARIERFDDAAGKTNLIVRIGPQCEGGLVLCGHMDTVPADEPDWSSGPFEMVERGGRLFGRGTCDMKGFVALAMNSMAAAAGGEALRRPLALLLTHDEEVGGLGAQRLVRECAGVATLPRSVIIGEPTRLAVVRMHKGHLKLRITIRGRPAHSGLPHLGINAIERIIDVLQGLRATAAAWRDRCPANSEYFPECSFSVLNIGMLRAGSAVNIVPEQAVVDIGIRLLPGQRSSDAIAEITAMVLALPAEIREAATLEIVNDNPPLLCDEQAEINRKLCEMLGQRDSRGVSFASDAGILSAAGLQCVLWGPGDMQQAHRANEYLEVEQLQIARRRLDEFVNRFCRE